MAGDKGPKRRLRFTKAGLTKLSIPRGGREYWHDSGQPGLTCCVQSSGSRTFYVYKWVQGKPERVRLGTFPDLSVENARDLAKSLIGDIAQGKDPMEERRRAREVPTLKEAFQVWLDAYAKEHRKSWQADERQFTLYLPRFHNRRLNTIRPAEIALWHNEVGQRHGRYQANRVLQLVRTVYRKSKLLLRYSGPNPCEGIRQFKEQSRDRFLTADELPRFFAALAQEQNVGIQAFFLLALLTGARESNLRAMRWDDVNWELRQWRIPQTKAGVPVVIPLCEAAIDALLKLKETATTQWVFPGENGGSMKRQTRGWERLLERSGLENLRLHDLRRSLGSWQAIGGSSLPVIGRSLGHTSMAATSVYARLSVDPVRESVERATTAMLEAGKVQETPDTEDRQ
jgi:integrase